MVETMGKNRETVEVCVRCFYGFGNDRDIVDPELNI